MTSLELFPSVGGFNTTEPTEWGTGELRAEAKEKVWIPRKPTWQYTGESVEQRYALTPLRLSNVRMTDQLLPDPEHVDMGPQLINKPFPAEHPYSSHIPRTALIPKFDSPEDPKRGVNARNQLPINNEMPASPYDVTIISKTKGSGLRHEIQALPKESEKRPLVWLGENGFNQLAKTHGDSQRYYPIPPKLFAPNLQDRPEDMKIGPRTANTLRNVEREQWQTSYNLTFSGLGDSNPLSLDNYDKKITTFLTTGTEDDNLYPRSSNTFDPPRPAEGRIARRIIAGPHPQSTSYEELPQATRKMILNDAEEDRLLNGKEYVNLPATEDSDASEHKPSFQVNFTGSTALTDSVKTPADKQPSYLDKLKDRQSEKFQEIEAQNRWKVLESQTPQNDIELLNIKYGHLNHNEKPDTFYDHEAKYNEERTGLYQTSYDPYRLYYSMNSLETSGPEIMNTMFSHADAINIPTELSAQMTDARKDIVTVNNQKSMCSKIAPQDVILSIENKKLAQKEWLQPSMNNSRMKVQEGETILTGSTKSDSFDVVKFLQENKLPQCVRSDPQSLMSLENQCLDRVRERTTHKPATKTVHFADKLSEIPAPSISNCHPVTVQYTSRHAQWKQENESQGTNEIVSVPGIPDSVRREVTMPAISASAELTFPNTRPMSVGLNKGRSEFTSLSTNFAPTDLKNSFSTPSAYQNQFPAYDLDYKTNPRFDWMPGFGTPRPQTKLLQIQDSFSKTDVRNKFNETFSENAPDLRQGIRQGKKHTFNGINAQLLHG